jgi:hypothetical protein
MILLLPTWRFDEVLGYARVRSEDDPADVTLPDPISIATHRPRGPASWIGVTTIRRIYMLENRRKKVSQTIGFGTKD